MILAVLILVMLASATSAETITIFRVVDGDTVVSQDGRRFRLWGIDAPESDQPYGTEARRELELLALGRTLDVVASRPGAWGRTDAVLAWHGIEVQSWLLSRGAAWVEPRYSTLEQRARWASVHSAAQNGRLGLYSERGAVPPWLWRSGARSASTGLLGPFTGNSMGTPQINAPVVVRRRRR